MKLYWVSMIIQDGEGRRPWLCAFTDGISSLSVAIGRISIMREHHEVLTAWIDVFDEHNNKSTIFHECYVDVLGNVEKVR